MRRSGLQRAAQSAASSKSSKSADIGTDGKKVDSTLTDYFRASPLFINQRDVSQAVGYPTLRTSTLADVKDQETLVQRQAFGARFHIVDDAALDACMQHHKGAVKLHGVKRYLVPMWLAKSQAAGEFTASYRAPDLRAATDYDDWSWVKTPTIDFSYPYGEHLKPNQSIGTYQLPQSLVGEAMKGSHVPGMLLSRQELLEEIEEMQHQPELLPFEVSSTTAIALTRKRVDRQMVMKTISSELKRFHPRRKSESIVYKGAALVVESLRPVFMPLYKLEVSTKTHSRILPTFVCGATGKCSGPVINVPQKQKIYMSGGVGFATLIGTALLTEPITAGAVAALAASAVTIGTSYVRHASASSAITSAEAMTVKDKMMYGEADEAGWKWSVEDEEKFEYHSREELRAKARKRADFEQRVREESKRRGDHAKQAFGQSRSKASRRTHQAPADPDPLGYYRLLGLQGKEGTATGKDVSQAFRVEAQRNHPDLHVGNAAKTLEAKDAMQNILEAYNVLRDVKLRKEYDAGLLTKRQS